MIIILRLWYRLSFTWQKVTFHNVKDNLLVGKRLSFEPQKVIFYFCSCKELIVSRL
ncbi:hypothetical protein HMPREF3218_0200814 [Prevotella bivia]|nr:hypothetical protein HMPREF3218_0200814 [Prevotella bivia]